MSDEPTQGQTSMSMRTVIVAGATLLTAAFVQIAGCGSSHPPLGGGGGGGVTADPNACQTAGDTRQCHVPVAANAGFVDCMAGTQTCDGTHFGACLPGGIMGTAYGSMRLDMLPRGKGSGVGTPKPRGTSPLKTLADPEPPDPAATLCAADPCDPYCYGWDDTLLPEGSSLPPYGDYNTLPPAGQKNVAPGMCKPQPNPTSDFDDCQNDMCCPGDNKTCVLWTVSQGRCKPNGDSFGNLSATSVGNCKAQPDFTLLTACDDLMGHTHVGVCNNGGATFNALLGVGFGAAGASSVTYPFTATTGYCTLDFSVIGGGLAAGDCGDFDVTAGTYEGFPNGVDCTGLPVVPPVGTNVPIFVNGGAAGYGAANNGDGAAVECNVANNWSYDAHLACLTPPPPGLPNFVSQSTLPVPYNTNVLVGCLDTPTYGAADQCQIDSCCPVAGGPCVDWSAGVNTGTCNPAGTMSTLPANGAVSVGDCATSPDFTITNGCNKGGGGGGGGGGGNTHRHFQICNRGAVAAPAAGILHVGFGSDGDPMAYPFNEDSGAECAIDLSNPMMPPLLPNICVDLDAVAGSINNKGGPWVNCNSIAGGQGARSNFFNGTNRPVRINTPPSAATDADVVIPECDGGNNFSFRQVSVNCTNAPPPPPQINYSYTAACPPGSRPQWKWLSFIMPNGGGDTSFDVSGQFMDPNTGVLGPTSATITVADPPTGGNPYNKRKCDYTNSNPPCPVNLGEASWNGQGPRLKQGPTDIRYADVLNLTLNSSDGKMYPQAWGMSFDCIPSE